MTIDTVHHEDIASLAGEAPADSILSRTLYDGPDAKVVLFAFAAGQSLSEHTAERPALLHLLSGTARIALGDATHEAGPGFWAHMPPRLPHSISAREPSVLLLVLLGAS